MQPIWNGDRRDRVKWAAIYYLSGKYRIRDIVWVVFKREETDPTLCLYETDRTLQKPDSTMPIPDRVWSHFSDLERINELFDDGRTIHIFSEPFEHHSRKEYINSVITLLSRVRKPCLVFLDPDIGIDPSKATAECVTVEVRGCLSHSCGRNKEPDDRRRRSSFMGDSPMRPPSHPEERVKTP